MRHQLLSIFLFLAFYVTTFADAQTTENANVCDGRQGYPYGNRVIHPYHRISKPVPKPTYVRTLEEAPIETTSAPIYELQNPSTNKPAQEYVMAAPDAVSIPPRPTFRHRLPITSIPEQNEQLVPNKEPEENMYRSPSYYGRPPLASRPIPRPSSIGAVTSPAPTIWTDKPVEIADNTESGSTIVNIVPRPTIASPPPISNIETNASAVEIQTPVELSSETPDYQPERRPLLPSRQVQEPNLKEVPPTLEIIYANSEPTPSEAMNTATVSPFQSRPGYSNGRLPLQSRPIVRPIQVVKIPEQTTSNPINHKETNYESGSIMKVPIRPTFRPRLYIPAGETTETSQLEDTTSNIGVTENVSSGTEANEPEITTQIITDEPTGSINIRPMPSQPIRRPIPVITTMAPEPAPLPDTNTKPTGSYAFSRYPRPYTPARPVPRPIPVSTTTMVPETTPLPDSNSGAPGSINFRPMPNWPSRPVSRPIPAFTTTAPEPALLPDKNTGSYAYSRYPRPYMPARPVPRPISVSTTTTTMAPEPVPLPDNSGATGSLKFRPMPNMPTQPVPRPIPVYTTMAPEPAPLVDGNSGATYLQIDVRYPRPYTPARPVPRPSPVSTTTVAPEPAPLLDSNSEASGTFLNPRYPRPYTPARPIPRPIPAYTIITTPEPTPLPITHDTVAAYTYPEFSITTERATTYPPVITIPSRIPSTNRPPIWTPSTKILPRNPWNTTPSPKYLPAPSPTRPKIPFKPYNITKNTFVEEAKPEIGSTGEIGIPYDYDCRQANGFYAFENECNKYLECKNNIAMKYECPDGLYFNPDALWPEFPCAYPSDVRCDGKSVKQTSSIAGECPRKNGFFALLEQDDCGKYVICHDGLAKTMHCPAGLVFNPQQSSCDWPENVPECKPNAFKGFTCPSEEEAPPDMIYKFRYGSSCKEYIACQRGHPRLLSCDPGLAFEEKSQTCIDHEYVRDCGFKA